MVSIPSRKDEGKVGGEDTPLISPPTNSYSFDDQVNEMTVGRRLARNLSSKSWYSPWASDPTTGPSLDVAWQFYEHMTLGRYFVETDGNGKNQNQDGNRDRFEKAEPGESCRPTKLYPVINTPEKELADFGIGVAVYFYTLRILGAIMFLAGVINLPNIWFYASGRYNGMEKDDDSIQQRHWALQGAAICTDQSWVACPTCTPQDWDTFPSSDDRYASTSTLTFIKRNNCRIDWEIAKFTYMTLGFIAIAVFALRKASIRKQVYFDEAAQTSTDYSIQVNNPPGNAYDAEEWNRFFSRFRHVVCCTVALNNEELIKALVARRNFMFQLEMLQQPNMSCSLPFDPNDLDKAIEDAVPLTWYKKTMCMKDAQGLVTEINALDETIRTDLAKRSYDVVRVFITFNTEAAQRAALAELSSSEDLLFRQTHAALKVEEPPEPSSVRWQDQDKSIFVQGSQQVFTFLLAFLFIVGSCFLVTYTRRTYGKTWSAMVVTTINTVIPMACRRMVGFESHQNEGSRQASLYLKIAAAMFVNTSVVTALITPYTDTLSNEDEALLPAIYAVFITELLRSPITQVIDITGNMYRHVLAPRCANQRRMNMYFTGSTYNLSDRYTNMTNMLFLVFYYSAIFPAGFFFGAATFTVHYWCDKYSVLRVWTQAPLVGTKIADFSRDYFFTMVVIVFSVTSSYSFASFQYDNACLTRDGSTVSSNYVGTFSATVLDGTPTTVTISAGDSNYAYCNQDMIRQEIFPAIPANQPVGEEWMSAEQEQMCRLFGWTSVVAIAFGLTLILYRTVIRKIWCHSVELKRKEMTQQFTHVNDIFGYIPEVKVGGYPCPILMCDIKSIGHELIAWRDSPFASFDKHNAIYDVAGVYDARGPLIFNTVSHWPPEMT